MSFSIRRVAVVGAGTMGAQIAAHCANVGLACDLLDVAPSTLTEKEAAAGRSLTDQQVANRLVSEAFERMKALRPSPLFLPRVADQIRLGNTRDHLDRLREADWIVEAVVERLPVKHEMLAAIEAHRRPGALVSSNTSGLSIAAMSEGRSVEFRAHFLGTHFFNPPRYLHLLELIPTAATRPDVLAFFQDFGARVLGKGIVVCRDTPYFIANRVGCYAHSYQIHHMRAGGYTVDEVDVITGEPMLRPRSATLRLADIVGLDLLIDVGHNLYEAVPHDPARELFRAPAFLGEMVARGWRGEKSGQGFYRRVRGAGGSEILTLDLDDLTYKPRQRPRFASIGAARELSDPGERLKTLVRGTDRASAYAWDVLSHTLVYAAEVAEEIADDPARVDDAMRWGWNWELGPFEQWDALGVAEVSGRLEAEGRPVPELARRVLADGGSFYQWTGAQRSFFHFDGGRRPLPAAPGLIVLKDRKAGGTAVRSGPEASLVDLGDGVLCVEFHTKVNVLGPGALEMVTRGLRELERDWSALVIGNQGRMFSAGANLALLLASAEEGEWDDIHAQIRQFQNTLMAVKCSPKPVVAAIFHQVLGGGCELALQSTAIQAAAETYVGLVELAVGLIPAGGGCKEMVIRSQEHLSPDDAEGDRWSPLHRAFLNIGLARTSSSAAEAREMGFLRATDRISVNPRAHLADAKALALSLAAHHTPYRARTDIPVLGEPALARLKLELHLMHRAGHISEHDRVLGVALATVLTGGPLTGPRLVSEQHLLDLEREEFARLCGYEKTRDRIRHMLKTNHPLRN